MKYIKQISIIMIVCLIGEWVSSILPFTMPAGIIAMLLMYGLLSIKFIKEKHIAETTDLLLQLMPLFIIPSSIAIINYLSIVQAIWLQLIIICFIGVIITFLCAYFTTKWLMEWLYAEKGEEEQHD
ncbi:MULTISPECIES: CidA/LrgA family protein [unclassified Granulicatella]|uniref:CidA/LrgA family protein n=1 Tax=unclassified Granulicatella TaxID=2630493 RepID=UPI00107437F5|nr:MULTISPECIES: CidA/LrgA family protein [unclassified Granulicatella]MBF0781043.1 CidA/LrgA family protein [Granulicatella sp. 19428wC4_WM01]TFU92445.1 CidA/LrgA family protein [Granulicatella sp. WM01]